MGLIDVDVTGRDRTGGLVGQNEGTITASYAAGSVSSSNNYAGGLVGYNKGAITASYSSGAVSGNDQVGGLAGRSEDGTIKASYSASAVTVRASVFGAGGTGRLYIRQHQHDHRQLFHRRGWRQRQLYRGAGRQGGYWRNGHQQLLGQGNQRPNHQRPRHGPHDRRAENAHCLHRHLRQLEPEPGRSGRHRRPLGLRHGHPVPAAEIRRPEPAHPAPGGLRQRQRRPHRNHERHPAQRHSPRCGRQRHGGYGEPERLRPGLPRTAPGHGLQACIRHAHLHRLRDRREYVRRRREHQPERPPPTTSTRAGRPSPASPPPSMATATPSPACSSIALQTTSACSAA